MWRDNRYFLLLFLVVMLSGAYLIGFNERLELHVQINQMVGNELLNGLFKALTYLGDGMFALFVIEVLFFMNMKNGIFALSVYLLSGGITQALKNWVFDGMNRPFYYHQYTGVKLKLVAGVEMYIHNSFPSGHATTAFCTFFTLSLLVKKQAVKVLCFFMALLVAFSRVYLSQHFLADVYAGACIAVLSVLALYRWYYYGSFSAKMEKWNKPLWKVFVK